MKKNTNNHPNNKTLSKIYSTKLSPLQKLILPNSNALLTSKPENLIYYTNFHSSNAFLFHTKSKTYLLTDSRYSISAQKIAIKLSSIIEFEFIELTSPITNILTKLITSHQIKTLLLETHHLTQDLFKKITSNLKLTLPNLTIKSSNKITEKLRLKKDPHEINLLQKAGNIADQTVEILKTKLRQNQTEREIAFLIEKIGRSLGADDISFQPIVGFNQNTSIPHHSPTQKKLTKNSIIQVDLGFKYKNYCSDLSRILIFGKPKLLPKIEKIYNAVLEAQKNAINSLKKTTSPSIPSQIAKETLEKFNLNQFFTHALGHGIGLEVHESPTLAQYNENESLEQTVFTIEPGVYLPKQFGIRIEDMIFKNGHSLKFLTNSNKSFSNSFINI